MSTAYFEERILFSSDVPTAVNKLLQAAVTTTHVDKYKAESLLKAARDIDTHCLQTYFALYKFYFFQGRLREAEREVIAGLTGAAQQGNFPNDYRQLA